MSFISIDKSGVFAKDKISVEKALPTPKQYAGWKFKEYVWCNPNELITQSSLGFTDNSVRLGGTPDNEELEALLAKGLDTSKLTISVDPDKNVINGFTRIKKLIKLGYTEWIVAVYERDTDTKTEFQDPNHLEDFIDDMRLGANQGDGSIPATTHDFQEIGIKRFEHRSDKSSLAVQRWVYSIPNSFSKKQVEAIANHVMKHYKRDGVVEKVTREDAEEIVRKAFPRKDVDVMNTKTHNYIERSFLKVQHAVSQGYDPVEFITFHSDATTWEEVDNARSDADERLMRLHIKAFQYVQKVGKITNLPWRNLGAIGQKIGDEDINTIV